MASTSVPLGTGVDEVVYKTMFFIFPKEASVETWKLMHPDKVEFVK